MSIDLTENEGLESSGSSGSNFFFDKNNYPKLILGTNEPAYITPLVDWLRGFKYSRHWDQKVKKFYVCNKTLGSAYVKENPCPHCESEDKDLQRSSVVKVFPTWAHSRYGKTRPSKDGTKTFIQDCIVFQELGTGENNANFDVYQKANSELLTDAAGGALDDDYYFYEDMGRDFASLGKTARFELQPDRLDKCGLMYRSDGSDKIYEVKKLADEKKKNKNGGAKVSYPPPALTDNVVLQRKLGPQAKLKVPKRVREHFNVQTIDDLGPFYFASLDLTEEHWKYLNANGIFKPEEGAKLTMEPEEMGHQPEAAEEEKPKATSGKVNNKL